MSIVAYISIYHEGDSMLLGKIRVNVIARRENLFESEPSVRTEKKFWLSFKC